MHLVLLFLSVFAFYPCLAVAADAPQEKAREVPKAFRSTGLPLPRFASLGSKEVYLRAGPGRRFPVEWVFKKEGLPVEIILEYDHWRKIRDFDGTTGWVHRALLSGKRSGIVTGKKNVQMHKKESQNSTLLAELQPKLLVRIQECGPLLCLLTAGPYKGWVNKSALWGVYEHEEFD